jgi:CBS domain-containing protein
MLVDDVMSAAKCCKESDTVRAAARLMREDDIGFVPICDDDGRPQGAITDRDLVIRVIADGRSFDENIGRFMTRDVVSCTLGDDVDEVERLMREHQKSRIMVCESSGRLKGVVSLADLAEVETDESAGETLGHVKSDQPAGHA